MKTCIICREEKTEKEFNEEHVIPESIAGCFVIKTVCRDCNNRMGTKLDHHLTSSFSMEIARNELGLKGSNGKIPDPLVGKVEVKNNPDVNASMVRNSDGKLIIKNHPITKKEVDDDDKITKLSITVTKSDQDNIPEMARKILAKHGQTMDEITSESIVTTTNTPEVVTKRIQISDYPKFLLAIIKIAYEFAVTTIPEYYDDQKGIRISRMLQNADKFAVDLEYLYRKNYLLLPNMVQQHVENCLGIIDLKSDNHYLILLQTPIGLTCHVNIFGRINEMVLLTDTPAYLKEGLFFILKNDVKNKSYEIFDWVALDKYYSQNSKL